MPHCPVCEAEQVVFFTQVAHQRYWRCTCCAATFLSPDQRPNRAQEKREYDLHHNDPEDPGYRRFLAQLAQPLLKQLPPEGQGLDYGCGPGPALALMLRETGHRVRCYDPIYYPASELLNERYEFITCTEVIEHMHRPASEFDRLDALLRPGGLLGIMTQFQTDDSRFANWHYRRDPTHVVFYRETTLRMVAARMHWEINIPSPNVAIFRKPEHRADTHLATR